MAMIQRCYSSDEYNALSAKYNKSKAKILDLEKEISSLEETLFIMSDPKRHAALLASIERIESGTAEFVTFTAEEFEEYSRKMLADEN